RFAAAGGPTGRYCCCCAKSATVPDCQIPISRPPVSSGPKNLRVILIDIRSPLALSRSLCELIDAHTGSHYHSSSAGCLFSRIVTEWRRVGAKTLSGSQIRQTDGKQHHNCLLLPIQEEFEAQA